MVINTQTPVIAFAGQTCIGKGPAPQALVDIKRYYQDHPAQPLLIFNATTSEPVEFNLSLPLDQLIQQIAPAPQPTLEEDEPTTKAPGRPKLGVKAREITLLPRHWDWLAAQPGGASATLRKLVENARRASKDADRQRQAQESSYRFMTTMAGNEPQYEEAIRALFAINLPQLDDCIKNWPEDIRTQVLALIKPLQE